MRSNSPGWKAWGVLVFSWLGASLGPVSDVRAADDARIPPTEWIQPGDFRFWLNELTDEAGGSGLTSLPPAEIYLRTQAVLEHFEVPEEPESQPLVSHLHGANSWKGIRRVLPVLDPGESFARYVLPFEGPFLEVFQDAGGFSVADYHIRVGSPREERSRLTRRLRKAASNPADRPLAGLRIALDPGHMGDDEWDRITGKYVMDHRGRKVSEGVIAMQTAALLAREFERLGAATLITRHSMEPVTPESYRDFSLETYARHELSAAREDAWFIRLLEQASVGRHLFRAFEESPDVRRIFSESMRWKYFIHKADLWERARLLRRFEPDITLVIHFDAHTGGPDASAPRATKIYIPGGFLGKELATREDRRLFADHLMDREAWEASLRLGRSVVRRMSERLEIPLQSTHGANAVKVEDGIFARNLALTRAMTGSAMSYLEVFFYNRPEEFEALLQTDHPLEIGGRNYPYSDRLWQVVEAIRDGVVRFVGN